MEPTEILKRIEELEREIALLPSGSIAVKRINDKEYYYHRINENGKRRETYVDFDDVAPDIVKDVVCPVCGGEMVVTPFGFGCRNYRKDDTQSCKFVVGEIAGKKLSASLLKQLLNERKTQDLTQEARDFYPLGK